jgi:hypothetical protein
MRHERQTEQHDDQGSTASRRSVLKSFSGAFAGATGLTVIASDAEAASTDRDAEAASKADDVEVASKAHDIEVVAESSGGYGAYRIVLPDQYATFSSLEGSDNHVPNNGTTIWTGEVNDGWIGTASDDAHFNGDPDAVEITTTGGRILVRVDTQVVYVTP